MDADALARITALRDAWQAAELAVATGQSYTIDDRTLTRADARLCASMRVKYQRQLNECRGIRIRRVMPRDL